jgi:hypothetical protein
MIYTTPFCFAAFNADKQVKTWNYDGFNVHSYHEVRKRAIDFAIKNNCSLEHFGISGVGCVVNLESEKLKYNLI